MVIIEPVNNAKIQKIISKNNNFSKNAATQNQSSYGREFESYIAMLFILRGIIHNYQFLVGVEIPEGMKFDDLVFIYKENDQNYFRCLQAKHTISLKKFIDLNKLINDADSAFNLVKYFFSYTDLINEDFFKLKINKDVLVYTNMNLNLSGIIGKNMVNENTWSCLEQVRNPESNKKTLNYLVNTLNDRDDILDVINRSKNRYQFNNIIVPTMLPKINRHNLVRVAQRLLDWLLEKKEFPQIEHVIKPYWKFLTSQIIDIENKKIYANFLQDDNTSDVNEDFRKIFIKELNVKRKTLKGELELKNIKIETTEDLNELLKKKIPGIEKNIRGWNTSSDVDFENIINENDINKFLKQYVFATNQPDYKELRDIVHNDIFNYIQNHNLKDDIDFYTESDIKRYRKDIFDNLCINIDNWKASKKFSESKDRIKTEIECRELLQNPWNEIQFDVKETVTSFTGREIELEHLHKKIRRGSTIQSQTTVICGLPGMGKTELVRGYVQKHKQRYENKIIWIDGKSQDSMEESFRRLAIDKLKIATTDDNNKAKPIKNLVNEIYIHFINQKCLFIFDDVQCPETLENFIPALTIEGNLPFIIVTSCNSNWNLKQKQELDVLSNEGAMKLITNRLRLSDNSMYKDVEMLAHILGYFPLALQQATAYISFKTDTSIQFSILDYIKAFKKNSQELLSYKLPKEISTYEKTTYDSFKNIIEALLVHEKSGNNAFKVIGVMSHLAPENIKVKWFSKYTNKELGRTVELLKEYSIVKIKMNTMSIHKLVQLVTKLTLKHLKLDIEIIRETYEFLNYNFPHENKVMDDYIKKCELLPHIEAFISNLDEKTDWTSDTAELRDEYLENSLTWLNNILYTIDPKKRKIVIERLLQLFERKYGKNSLKFGYLLRDLNVVYYHLGDYKNQKIVLDEAMPIFEKHYSADSVYTLSVLYFIGIAHKNIGEHLEAQKIYEKILPKYLEVYGEKHIETGKLFQQMAVIQRQLGCFLEAKTLMSQALVAYENEYGPHHLETAVIQANLGIVEKNLGNHERTRELFKFALSSFKQYMNPNNIRISATLNNVALLESDLGNYSLAKEMLEQALETTKQLFGTIHSKTATVYDSLSTVEIKLGNFIRAKFLAEIAKESRLTNFKPDHIRVVTMQYNLGIAERELGNLTIAKKIFENTLSSFETQYSLTNIKTVAISNDLANTESELGNHQVAKILLEFGVLVLIQNYGTNHFHTATIFNDLGAVEINLGNYSQAKELFDKALFIRNLQFGPDHILTSEVLLNIGILNKKQRLYDDSKQQLTKALAVYENHYGSLHLKTFSPLYHLGDLQVHLGNYNEANEFFTKALKICKNDTDAGNINTARILLSFCEMQMKLEKYNEAKKFIEKSLNLYNCHISVASSEIIQATYLLGEIQSKLANYKEAIESLGFALLLCTLYNEDENFEKSRILNALAIIGLNLGKNHLAKELLERTLVVYERQFGREHLETIRVIDNLKRASSTIHRSLTFK